MPPDVVNWEHRAALLIPERDAKARAVRERLTQAMLEVYRDVNERLDTAYREAQAKRDVGTYVDYRKGDLVMVHDMNVDEGLYRRYVGEYADDGGRRRPYLSRKLAGAWSGPSRVHDVTGHRVIVEHPDGKGGVRLENYNRRRLRPFSTCPERLRGAFHDEQGKLCVIEEVLASRLAPARGLDGDHPGYQYLVRYCSGGEPQPDAWLDEFDVPSIRIQEYLDKR